MEAVVYNSSQFSLSSSHSRVIFHHRAGPSPNAVQFISSADPSFHKLHGTIRYARLCKAERKKLLHLVPTCCRSTSQRTHELHDRQNLDAPNVHMTVDSKVPYSPSWKLTLQREIIAEDPALESAGLERITGTPKESNLGTLELPNGEILRHNPRLL